MREPTDPAQRCMWRSAEDVIGRLCTDPYRNDDRCGSSHVPSLAYRLAMVADGRIDGTVVKRNSHDWDLAAADLILERAGGALNAVSMRAPCPTTAPMSVHGVLCAALEGRVAGIACRLQGRLRRH